MHSHSSSSTPSTDPEMKSFTDKRLCIIDGEIDDIEAIKEKLSTPIRNQVKILAILISAGKDLDTFQTKLSFIQELCAIYQISPQIFLGCPNKTSQFEFGKLYDEYKECSFIPLTQEKFEAILAEANSIDCTGPLNELLEIFFLNKLILKDKILNIYGSTNTNIETVNYLINFYADKLKVIPQAEIEAILSPIQKALTKELEEKRKKLSTTDPEYQNKIEKLQKEFEKNLQDANKKIAAHLFLDRFYATFNTHPFLFESQPFAGQVTGGQGLDSRNYPLIGAYNRALLDEKQATPLGHRLGQFGFQQASFIASQQALKFVSYLRHARETNKPKYDEIIVALANKFAALFTARFLQKNLLPTSTLLCEIHTDHLNGQGLSALFLHQFSKDPYAMLMCAELINDEPSLNEKQAGSVLSVIPDSMQRISTDIFSQQEMKALEANNILPTLDEETKAHFIEIIPFRAFDIYAKTGPYGYQRVLADYFTTIKDYELTRANKAERVLLSKMTPQHVCNVAPRMFAEFKEEGSAATVYYGRTLPKEEAADFTTYLDLVLAKLNYEGDLTLVDGSNWRTFYQETGLANYSPYEVYQLYKNNPKGYKESLNALLATPEGSNERQQFKQNLEKQLEAQSSVVAYSIFSHSNNPPPVEEPGLRTNFISPRS